MKLSVASTANEFQALETSWDALTAADRNAWPFQDHAWLSAMVQLEEGPSARPQILTLTEGVNLLAALPLIREQRYGPLGYTVMRFLGDGMNDSNDAIVHPRADPALVFGEIARWITAQPDVDLVHLKNVNPDSHLHQHHHRLVLGSSFVPLVPRQTDECLYIPLPSSIEEYRNCLRSEFRARLRRTRHQLEHTFDVRFEDRAPLNGDGAIDAFIALHSKRRAERYQRGLFQKSLREDVFRGMCAELGRRSILTLHTLRLDGAFAYVLCALQLNGKCAYYNAGFDSNPRYRPFGIGKLVLAQTIESTIGSGIEEFNLGRGIEQYKRDFARKTRANYELVAHKPGLGWLVHSAHRRSMRFVFENEHARRTVYRLFRLRRLLRRTVAR